MLSFDIRSLESQAAHVDGTLSPDDPVWEAGDLRPSAPIHVEGRLSAAGPTRFYFSGRLSGVMEMPCRRCLEDVTVDVAGEEHFIFSAEGEEGSDDPDVFPFDPRALARHEAGGEGSMATGGAGIRPMPRGLQGPLSDMWD